MGFCNPEFSSEMRKAKRGRRNSEDEKSNYKVIWASATRSPAECRSRKAEGGMRNMRNQSPKLYGFFQPRVLQWNVKGEKWKEEFRI